MPTKTTAQTVLDPEILKRVDALAAQQARSRSAMIARLVTAALDAFEKAQGK